MRFSAGKKKKKTLDNLARDSFPENQYQQKVWGARGGLACRTFRKKNEAKDKRRLKGYIRVFCGLALQLGDDIGEASLGSKVMV